MADATALEQEAIRLLKYTWEQIGGDALANAAYEQFGYGINPHDINPATKDSDDPDYGYGCTYAESATMDGESVREVALDCLQTRGRPDEEAAVTWLREQSYERKMAVVRKALPGSQYGY